MAAQALRVGLGCAALAQTVVRPRLAGEVRRHRQPVRLASRHRRRRLDGHRDVGQLPAILSLSAHALRDARLAAGDLAAEELGAEAMKAGDVIEFLARAFKKIESYF